MDVTQLQEPHQKPLLLNIGKKMAYISILFMNIEVKNLILPIFGNQWMDATGHL